MTDAKQPAQFDWVTELSDAQGHVTLSEQEAKEIGARLRTGYEAARLEIESLRARSLPEIKGMHNGPEQLNLSDRAMWALGWNECRDAMRAAQPVVAQQPGAAYAALPDGVATLCEYGGDVFTAAQMRAFADATYTIRASHGQAPAQAAPAAVAGPIGYGPKVTVKRSCSDCKACNSESYAVQGDSGHYVYCGHPSLPESKYIGDTNWNTPHWCPVSAPTTQPAPQQEAQEPYSIDADPQVIRAIVADAITGVLAFGAQGTNAPPDGHWLAPFWAAARAEREAAPQPSPAAQGDALDTMRLDWLDADDSRCVFHLGKSWYTRPSYGLPYRKRASLREAIDSARAAQEGNK